MVGIGWLVGIKKCRFRAAAPVAWRKFFRGRCRVAVRTFRLRNRAYIPWHVISGCVLT